MRAKILFVCLGNICRSPTAEAVFRARALAAGKTVLVDSAGTASWHVGQPPDDRACATAASRGYDMSALRARQVEHEDFLLCDHILAMDSNNLHDLQAMRPQGGAKPRLFLEFAPDAALRDVPDPYSGGDHGFIHVLNLIEQASDGLLVTL